MEILMAIWHYLASDAQAGLSRINELRCWPFIFIATVEFARMEIAGEGKYGWAYRMPTYYQFTGFGRFFRLIQGGKPATGYHVPMNKFMVCVFYFTTGLHPVAGILALLVIGQAEDFLWFMLNPDYGWKKFNRDDIAWHRNMMWIGRIPIYYITSVAFVLVLCLFLGCFIAMAVLIAKMLVATILTTIFVAPAYRRWYAKKMKNDERNLAEKYGFFPPK